MKSFAFFFLALLAAYALISAPSVASDFTLNIFGNANMDDIIDEKDTAYVEGVIDKTNAPTNLSDANHDGKIDENDISQIAQIIAGEEEELIIIDSSNRTVVVKLPVDSIVSLSHTSAEAIKILGAKDRIIGVEQNVADKTAFFPDLSRLPVMKSGSSPDYEMILEAKPDLVIGYHTSAAEYAGKLDAHLTVVGLGFYQPKKMSQEIAMLGYLLGRTEEAYEFIDFCESYLDTIHQRVSELTEDEKVSAYLEQNSDLKASGNGSGTNELCEMAGGVNIAVDLVGSYPTVDPEWVITEDPDVMVKSVNHGDKYAGYEKDTTKDIEELRNSFTNRTGWQMIKAVQNERVFMWSDSISTKPSFFIGVAYLAKLFYPELFDDLNPQAIHQEYLTRFHRLDYDLDKHGVFVYPSITES
jgi:iron complex transport system substrate-binding protein